MSSRVAVLHKEKIGEAIPGALNLLGDLADLFTKRQVVIKPNETWASRRDPTACTQADTLQAVIRYVKRFRPAEIIVSGGSGAGETDDIFRVLGIDRVIQEEKVEFIDHNRGPFQEVKLDYGPEKTVLVNPRVLEYDILISLAQHKVHHKAKVTLSMKNIAMSYPAADYYGHPRAKHRQPHNFFKDIHRHIVGMCHKFPIDLAIIAGHPAMTGTGPIGGHTFESGLTIASRDFVAADTIGAQILGINKVDHLEEAESLNLGTSTLNRIEVVGTPLEKARRIFAEQERSGPATV